MKIALVGYGKMGREVEKVALERGHRVVCIIDENEGHKFESEEFRSADIVIEFTSPTSAVDNYKKAFSYNKPVVSGTTGWLARVDEIKQACEKEGQTFFYASNFSLGVNIFFALNRYLAKIMAQFTNYNVHMEETHHIHKLDAPSGTAITLAEDILNSIDRKKSWQLLSSEEDEPTTDALSIRAYREGENPGVHTVTYGSEADTITISHSAKNRRGFALGAILAAEFTLGKKGFLGMDDMLNFSR